MPIPTIDFLLGSAYNFLVLGATPSVTNSGATVLTGGDLGIFPAASVTGFPPGIVTPPNAQHIADTTAHQAQTDAQTAYTYFQNLIGGTTVVGNLAGQTLSPGIYSSATTMDLSVGGTLTLDGGGDPEAVFVFQVGSALTINTGATVVLQNGAHSRNIVWVCGSAATIGSSAVMKGSIIAEATVALGTSASLSGRAISLTAAVTLLGNSITLPAEPVPVPPLPPVPPPIPPTPPNPSNKAFAVLSEICHPDITGKTLRSWGLVTIVPGAYVTGGIPMGLYQYLDVRTVDLNGFLKCDVWGEEEVLNLDNLGGLFIYHYSPVGDVLQIFSNRTGVEVSNGAAIPLAVLVDTLLFECTVDRTTVRG